MDDEDLRRLSSALAAAAASTHGSARMSGGGVGVRGIGEALLDRGRRFNSDDENFSSGSFWSDSNRTVFSTPEEAFDFSILVSSFSSPIRSSDSSTTSGAYKENWVIKTEIAFIEGNNLFTGCERMVTRGGLITVTLGNPPPLLLLELLLLPELAAVVVLLHAGLHRGEIPKFFSAERG